MSIFFSIVPSHYVKRNNEFYNEKQMQSAQVQSLNRKSMELRLWYNEWVRQLSLLY